MTWRDKAACRNAPDPELWWPVAEADMADEARKICWRCPVQTQCGAEADDRDEKHGVHAGHRMWVSAERRHLKRFLGRLPVKAGPPPKICRVCGAQHTSPTRTVCERPECRGLASADPPRARIKSLYVAGWTSGQIADAAGLSVNTIRHLINGRHGLLSEYTQQETADAILSVPIPEWVVI